MALKYVGDGTRIPGVPDRDLSDEEEAQYGERIIEQQMHSARILYEPVKKDGGEKKQKSQEDKR